MEFKKAIENSTVKEDLQTVVAIHKIQDVETFYRNMGITFYKFFQSVIEQTQKEQPN